MTRASGIRAGAFVILLVWAAAFAGCGGGSDGDEAGAAETLATRLLGSEPTDETRADHECIAAAIADEFDTDEVRTLADTPDLDDLDLPSSERLLRSALSCVTATDLGG